MICVLKEGHGCASVAAVKIPYTKSLRENGVRQWLRQEPETPDSLSQGQGENACVFACSIALLHVSTLTHSRVPCLGNGAISILPSQLI